MPDDLYARDVLICMGEPRPLPEACPFVLDDVPSVRPGVAALAAKLAVVV